MSKKIVIVQPSVGGPEQTDKYQKEAEEYVQSLGYEVLSFNANDILEVMAKGGTDCDFSSGPFIIGATSILMAIAGNVCFGRGWKNFAHSVELFEIAFRYGLNILNMEIVPEE